MSYETLKRPMKQVQGMVQGDISRVLGQPLCPFFNIDERFPQKA
jgi:hypothetical protein